MTGSQNFVPPHPASVLIIGTEPSCGKTVFMCGVAGALREQGFVTRVLKPMMLTPKKGSDAETNFLTTVGQTPQNYPITFMDKPLSYKETNWQNAILMSRSTDHLTFVEMPGSAATPICYEETNAGTVTNNWKDCADMAYEFIQPCIVVAKHQADAIEQLVLTCSFLKQRGLVILATATVEVSADGGVELERKRTRADFSIGLQTKTGVPFIGCIKHSQVVSVPRVSQGNLVRQTQAGVDLLPLIKALNLAVPTN